jgi:hypothetical protein
MKHFIIFSLFVLSTLHINAQNQTKLLQQLTANSLIPASVVQNKTKDIKTKGWPITIETQNGQVSKIILKRAGVIDEFYEPDIPKNPAYFYNNKNRIVFFDGILHYYQPGQNSINILYLLSDSKQKLEAYDVTKAEGKLKAYFEQMRIQQKDAKEDLVANLEKAKEEERIANSLQGKNIKSLEIVWLTKDSETGMQSKIQYGVKAIDAGGTVFTTDNLGGKTSWDDFVISSVGAIPANEFLTVDTDASKIKGDKVTLTVKSKYHPAVTVSTSIKMSYATSVRLAYTGANGCPPLTGGTGTRGGNAPHLDIKACNSLDNQFVLVEVANGGTVLHRIKVKKGVPIYIDVTGGPGCSGKSTSRETSGGRGGNGGDGGNVTISKNANLTGDAITIYNSGGKGGRGGEGISLHGPDGTKGRDGITKYNITSVNLNF